MFGIGELTFFGIKLVTIAYTFLFGLAILTLITELPFFKERILGLIDGKKGIIFVPLTIAILIMSVAIIFYTVKLIAPNIGLIGSAGSNSGDTSGGHVFTWAVFDLGLGFVMIPVIVVLCAMCNYYEELYFRDSKKQVGIWSVLHMAMGVPFIMIPSLFSVGLVFKAIKDRYGLNTAYATHFFHNMVIVCLMMLRLTIL